MDKAIPEISVVICSRNRADLLSAAIRSVIQGRDVERIVYEIIIVDDHSTDHTAAVVQHFSQTFPQVRYIKSTGQGMLHARVTGQTCSRGRYIAYLDDDARACTHWLSHAAKIIQERQPICFGGPFFPFYISRKPQWYRDEYGAVTYGAYPRVLQKDEYFCGNNIFFDAEGLRNCGGFDATYCTPDERWTYGDEDVPQMRLRKMYPHRDFFYDPELSILHLVRPDRLNIVRAARECFAMGRAYVKLTGINKDAREFPYAWRFALSYLRFWFDALIGIWFRDPKQFRYAQNYVYESAFKELRRAAVFYESFRAIHKLKRGGGEGH